jgi:hypothetical protein
MAVPFDPVWAHSGNVEAPDAQRIAVGFTCGGVPPAVFNWLFQSLQQALNAISDLGSMVPALRRINTTEGIQGGGTLESDRTLRLNIPGLESTGTANGTDLLVIFRGSQHYHTTRSAFLAGVGGGGGSITDAENIGGGPGEVYSALDTDTLQLRTLDTGSAGLSVNTSGDKVVIAFNDFVDYTVN